MDLEALLKALDPDGTLWEEAKEKGMLLPGDEITSLNELRVDCEQRVKSSPFEISNEYNVFRGGSSKGYNVISRNVLLKCCRNEDGTENQKSEFMYLVHPLPFAIQNAHISLLSPFLPLYMQKKHYYM